MKSLIVLRGVSSQGKSSTLNLLRQRLEGDSNYKIIKSEPHPDGYDRTSIVDGPFGKVGIITFGDPYAEEHVNALLNEMLSAGVVIIFAASRTRGGVWNVLNSFASEHGFNLIQTSTLHTETVDDTNLVKSLNSAVSEMLFSLIETLKDLNDK